MGQWIARRHCRKEITNEFKVSCASLSAVEQYISGLAAYYSLPDYRREFKRWFKKVEINILERQESEFNTARIRHEYLTNDAAVDSVTLISIFSQYPNK